MSDSTHLIGGPINVWENKSFRRDLSGMEQSGQRNEKQVCGVDNASHQKESQAEEVRVRDASLGAASDEGSRHLKTERERERERSDLIRMQRYAVRLSRKDLAIKGGGLDAQE
jgi:hypothetical protein